MFNFTLPADNLTHFVERIHEVDIPRPSTFDENRIIPMGTGTITFMLKGNPRVQCINGIQIVPDHILSGQYYPTFSFDSDVPLLHYGIALTPMATYKLFGISLSDIKNDFIELSEIIGEEASQVRQQLLRTHTTEERYRILNNFMLGIVPKTSQITHLEVIIDYIYAKKGILKVADLCQHKNVSRRYLEMKFKKFIGFTPGQFIRQVRFNFTCSKIAEGKMPVNDILTKFGYYDRSHFMKKFKKFYGSDLSALTGNDDNIFKDIFSQI